MINIFAINAISIRRSDHFLYTDKPTAMHRYIRTQAMMANIFTGVLSDNTNTRYRGRRINKRTSGQKQ